MATNYTGTPTQDQQPPTRIGPENPRVGYTAPEPEKAIAGYLPTDGGALAVASIHQPLKTLLDHVAWLFKPRAKLEAWTQQIMSWRTASQHKRFSISHFGFPAGRINHVRDEFLADFSATGNAIEPRLIGSLTVSLLLAYTGNDFDSYVFGSTPIVSSSAIWTQTPALLGWRYRIRKQSDSPDVDIAGTAEVSFNAPTIAANYHRGSRYIKLSAAKTVGDCSEVSRRSTFAFHESVVAELEFDGAASLASGIGSDSIHVVGWKNESDFGVQLPTSTGAGGAWFQINPGVGLSCVVSRGDAYEAVEASGPDWSWHRFKIAWVGSLVDDVSTARVLFFIDGVLVANVTNSDVLPTPGHVAAFYAGSETVDDSANESDLLIGGPVLISNNTWVDEI